VTAGGHRFLERPELRLELGEMEPEAVGLPSEVLELSEREPCGARPGELVVNAVAAAAPTIEASIPPLEIMSSFSAGRSPSNRSNRSAMNARGPGSPRVGEYCRAVASPLRISSAKMSAMTSPGNVDGSGNPPENEMMSVTLASARIEAMPSPTPPFVRLANASAQVLAR